MIYLAPTGIFSFATDATIPTRAILNLLVYQLVPELCIDFYCTFLEINNGLRTLHESYWKADTGADQSSKFWSFRLGDLFRATMMKFWFTITLTFFTLAICLK